MCVFDDLHYHEAVYQPGVALVALQMERVGHGSGPGGVHDGGVVVVVIAKVG